MAVRQEERFHDGRGVEMRMGEHEAENDFIAFVRRNGETFTFESEKALKEYADTLPTETDQPV